MRGTTDQSAQRRTAGEMLGAERVDVGECISTHRIVTSHCSRGDHPFKVRAEESRDR